MCSERLCLSNLHLQCSKNVFSFVRGQVSRSKGWVELAENFLEPFAKSLRFYSKKSRQTLMVSQVVSLCFLSGIFEGEKLSPFLLK